jgi:hypothetical protein
MDARKVVLHKAWHASHYQIKGRLEAFSGFHANFAGSHNAMLEAYYNHFLQLLPTANVLEVPKSSVLASDDHPWGRQPFHYIKAYYEQFIVALDAIANQAKETE